MMKEKPIIFKGEMVRAILEGRKTQTRRPCGVIKEPYGERDETGWPYSSDKYGEFHKNECPFGKVGDRLWIRETYGITLKGENSLLDGPLFDFESWDEFGDPYLKDRYELRYRADGDNGFSGKWRPSIHMPRYANRVMLEITGIRVEQLTNISPEDCLAEGIEPLKSGRGYYDPTQSKGAVHLGHYCHSEKDAFSNLWDSAYGSGAFKLNPWVWVIEFNKAGETI